MLAAWLWCVAGCLFFWITVAKFVLVLIEAL